MNNLFALWEISSFLHPFLITQEIPTVHCCQPWHRERHSVFACSILYVVISCLLPDVQKLWSNMRTSVEMRLSAVVHLCFVLYPISTLFCETHLTYIVLWSSWCGLCGDQPESGLCTRGHHADVSCDHPGRPGPTRAGGAREVWTGSPDAHEWDPRGAKQSYHPH